MVQETNYVRYSGKLLTEVVEDHPYQVPDFIELQTKEFKPTDLLYEDIDPYFPNPELQDAVEYARLLHRPLLLRGEPGCGKTRLAQALAYEMYYGTGENYRDHYFEWYIKSTTRAVDGLYSFDHLARMRDVQTRKEGQELPLKHTRRSFGPLGKAFLASTPEKPAVLLIDEIDKADIDFPNDLLLELDQQRFFIEETDEEIRAKYPPIIIITSNDEKELPKAFLRRCVFYYIEFPDHKQLLKIAWAKADQLTKKLQVEKTLPTALIKSVVTRFEKLYREMKANPNTDKRPSTSELLDLLRIVHFYYLTGDKKKLPLTRGRKLPDDGLLFPEVLLKTLTDYQSQTNK